MSSEGTWGKAPLVGHSSLSKPRPTGAPNSVSAPAQPCSKDGTSCCPREQSALCRVTWHPKGRGRMWGAPSLMPEHLLVHENVCYRSGAKARAGTCPMLRGGPILLRHRAGSGRAAVWPSTQPGLVSVEAAGTWAPAGAGKGEQSCGQGDAKASPSPPPRREGCFGQHLGDPQAPNAHPEQAERGAGGGGAKAEVKRWLPSIKIKPGCPLLLWGCPHRVGKVGNAGASPPPAPHPGKLKGGQGRDKHHCCCSAGCCVLVRSAAGCTSRSGPCPAGS